MSVTITIHRVTSLLFFLHLPLLLMSSVGLTATVHAQLYGGTFGSAIFAMLMRAFKKRIARDFVLRIDFDVNEEVFIVTIPPSSFTQLGEPEKLTVSPRDFQMMTLQEQKEKKGCLYKDA